MALPGAAAARGPRLRLTRKKPPAPPSSSCSGPGGGGGQEGRTSNKRSWLDQEGLSESEELWRLLVLRSVNSSQNQGSQEMPDLPAFFDKNTRNDENSQQPSVFKVGTEEFQWTPFPPAFASVSGQLRKPDSSRFTKEKNPRVLDEQGQKMGPQSELSSPGASAGGCEKQEARPGSGAGVKRPSDLKDGSVRASKGRLPAHPQQSQLRKKQRLCVEGAAASSASPRGLGHLGHSSGKKPGRSLDPDGARGGTEAASAGPSQGTGALNGCPMCQQQFTGKFSQLDIDSHLAKCLSESIEDVIW
ncbi:Fanconi anemia core complex-associated protein 20 isoform X2 [Antechinus flavipes]|uniref:Fanconi anemia core complex-associated protein 20 isoform X2 n=1 Tax=Antechinus flavipes TaxID=38775 RepID=UPI00223574C8|nr:Fanconi anemia core complex-associated protein 20 isoform X2 [Antechinus flavipes]